MKKLLAIVISMAMIVAMMPMGVFAGEGENGTVEVKYPADFTEESWTGNNTVYYNGTQYEKLTDALTAVYKSSPTDTATLYCKQGADVGTMTHGHVADSITIYGNGAYVSGGECDLEVDTYKFSRLTGAQSNDGTYLDNEITIEVNNLNGIAAWGERHTAKTVNLEFNNCKYMNRVYITGTTGTNNITLNNCSFDATRTEQPISNANTTVYSNAAGTIAINNCVFNGIAVAVNINHKSTGEQSINISGCQFTNCGSTVTENELNQYAAPVRFVNSGTGKMAATVANSTITGTIGNNGDILLGEGRANKNSNKIELTMSGTNATVQQQEPGYYDANGSTVEGKMNSVEVFADNDVTTDESGNLVLSDVAEIGENGYSTLQAAIDAASDGDTIKLIKDVTLNATLNISSGRIILDLAGNTINVTKSDRPIRPGATKYHSNGIHISGNSDLTITGNGTIKAPDDGSICASMDSSSLMQVEGESAKLTILNGKLIAGGEGSNGMYGIYVYNGGNVVLGNAEAGPIIETFCAAVGENNTTSPANITINNGVYTETLTPADTDSWAYFCAPIYAAASGNITITGGTFNGYYGISSRYKNVEQNITISGGTFNGSKSAIFVDNNIPNGSTEREKSFSITGGIYSTSPAEEYVAKGYKVNQISENSYEVVKEYTGGGAVVPPTTDNVTNNVADKNTTADLTPAVSDNKSTTTVDNTTADKIVDKAVENKSTEVIVDATGNNTVASSEVAIPEKTVKEISEKTDANLVIKTDNGQVDLDKAALAAVAEQAGTAGTVTLVVETVKTDENICHVDLKLVTSNGAVKDFKGGNVKVTITLDKELAAKELVCVYIDDNGIYTIVEGVLNADGTYTFTTGHFSEYAVMAKDEADKVIADQLNTLIKEVNLKVRTSKTSKKNIKAVVSGDVKALTDAGYTVKYKFYRSTKKSSKYEGKVTKDTKTYINTVGKKGTKYYYKAKALVYQGDKLVGQTVLTQCKYGVRTWSK